MSITGAFIAGFLVGELLQLGAWKMGRPERALSNYFKESWGHWCVNLAVVTIMGVLWWSEMLGPLLGHLGFTPIAQLLAVSPPFGFLLACFSDVMGDKISYGVMTYLSKKFPHQTTQGESDGKDLSAPQAP